jgi:prophage regulatory protein
MPEALLSIADVCRRVRLGKSAIYVRIKAGSFPRPLDLGTTVRWRESDIDAWIAALPTTSATSAGQRAAPRRAAGPRAADRPTPAQSRA